MKLDRAAFARMPWESERRTSVRIKCEHMFVLISTPLCLASPWFPSDRRSDVLASSHDLWLLDGFLARR